MVAVEADHGLAVPPEAHTAGPPWAFGPVRAFVIVAGRHLIEASPLDRLLGSALRLRAVHLRT